NPEDCTAKPLTELSFGWKKRKELQKTKNKRKHSVCSLNITERAICSFGMITTWRGRKLRKEILITSTDLSKFITTRWDTKVRMKTLFKLRISKCPNG